MDFRSKKSKIIPKTIIATKKSSRFISKIGNSNGQVSEKSIFFVEMKKKKIYCDISISAWDSMVDSAFCEHYVIVHNISIDVQQIWLMSL